MRKIFSFFAAVLCAVSMSAETFIKVTDASTLKDGDKVVMGYQKGNNVSAGFSSTKKFLDVAAATFSGDNATLDNPTYITLKKNGNLWNLFIGSKPIGHTSGDNSLDTKQRYTTDYAITITDGVANIVSQTPGKNSNEVFFAYNASSPRFALYMASSNMASISLYKLDEGSVPDVVAKTVTLSKNELAIRVGNTETLTAEVLPADAVDKSIAWGSTDKAIATVADGKITAVAVGTAKIWVKATAVENVTDTCVVTVLPAAAEGTATYNAVQKADYLPEGAKVFIGTIKDGENYVMGQYVSGNNIKGAEATYGTNRHSVTAPLQVAYTVHIEDGKYMFADHDGNYLRTLSTSKLGSGENDQYAKWTLGAFDEDDATVVLTSSNGKGLYNNWQGTNDMFNIYSGLDDSYLAKIILYSDKAPAWEEREKHPSMVASGEALTQEGDVYTLDWGKQPMDEYSEDWGDSRKFTITVTDLDSDVEVTLDQTGEEFYCGWVSSGIKKDRTTPAEITVFWQAASKGTYTGTLRFHTETAGVADIVVKLHAEAVDQAEDPDLKPTLTLSTNTIILNPNYEEMSGDLKDFTFSAANLAKALYIKWEHSGPLFAYDYENSYMEILVGDASLALNGSVQLPAGQDYKDVEVLVSVSSALASIGTYTTKLHFYSYKKDSKTDLAIDEYVTITTKVTETPDPQGVEDVQSDKIQTTKVLRNGQLYLMYEGQMYDVRGARVQ